MKRAEYSDMIRMEGMRFFGRTGLLDFEKRDGQIFVVDLYLYFSRLAAVETDRIEDTVHYGEVFETVRTCVEAHSYNMIEYLGGRIAQEVFRGFSAIEAIEVTVRKPDAPVNGDFDAMGVTLYRERSEMNLAGNRAYLSLGTNMGDRMKNLKDALARLSGTPGIRLGPCSSVYETDPVGYLEQDPFLNLVCLVDTDLSPFDLLQVCLRIEKELLRVRTVRYGPRTIDIDILNYYRERITGSAAMFSEVLSEDPDLVLPHPRMAERAFVLIPLAELKGESIPPDPAVRLYAPPITSY